MNSQFYLSGFNNGYLITQYRPDIASMIFTTLTPTSEYLHGLVDGHQQFQFEQSKNKKLSALQRLREQAQNKSQDFEKDN